MKTKKKIVKKLTRVLHLSKKPIKRKYFLKNTKNTILKFQRFNCNANKCSFPKNSWRYLEFDHIRNKNDNSISNCQALCPFHHRQKTKRDRLKKQIEKNP